MEWTGKLLSRREHKRQHHASRGRAVDTPELRHVERFVRGQQELYYGNNPTWEDPNSLEAHPERERPSHSVPEPQYRIEDSSRQARSNEQQSKKHRVDSSAFDRLGPREAGPAKDPASKPLNDVGITTKRTRTDFNDGRSQTNTEYHIPRSPRIGGGLLDSGSSGGRAPYEESVYQYPRLDTHHAPLRGSDRYTGPRDSSRHGSRLDEYYGPARHDRYVSTPVRSAEQGYVPTRHDEHDHMPAQFDEDDRFIPVRYDEADYVPGWYDGNLGEVVSVKHSKNCHIDARRHEHGNNIPVRFGGQNFLPSEVVNFRYGIFLMVRYRGEDLLRPRQHESDHVPLPITAAAETHRRLLEAPSEKGSRHSHVRLPITEAAGTHRRLLEAPSKKRSRRHRQ